MNALYNCELSQYSWRTRRWTFLVIRGRASIMFPLRFLWPRNSFAAAYERLLDTPLLGTLVLGRANQWYIGRRRRTSLRLGHARVRSVCQPASESLSLPVKHSGGGCCSCCTYWRLGPGTETSAQSIVTPERAFLILDNMHGACTTCSNFWVMCDDWKVFTMVLFWYVILFGDSYCGPWGAKASWVG